MKKLIAILLTAAMLLGLGACGGPKYDEALMGLYTCYEGEAMGVSMPADELFEDDCTIELKQGGKGTFHMDGEDYAMKYTLSGDTITFEADGETGTGTLGDGLMEIEILGLKLYLSKDGVAAAAAGNAGDAGEAATNSDAGYYILTSITEGGETTDEAMLKEYGFYGMIYLVLNEDGTGVMDLGEDDVLTLTWEPGLIIADGETLPYTLEGDVMTIVEDGVTMSYTRSNDTPPMTAAPGASAEEPAGPAISAGSVSGDLDEYHVTILAAESFTDADGNPAIRFYYDFTNNSSELESAWASLNYRATQDGNELTYTYAPMDDKVPEHENDLWKVIPGLTAHCVQEYCYDPDGGMLEFTISDVYDNELKMEFDPQNLPGRPDSLESPVITDPSFTASMPSEGVVDEDYYVRIDSCEYVPCWSGGEVVRVYFEFTNNSDAPTNMFVQTYLIALQDGMELETDYADEDVLEDDNYRVDVDPGESIMASVCFAVRSDSPIEIIVYDFWGDGDIGMVLPAA